MESACFDGESSAVYYHNLWMNLSFDWHLSLTTCPMSDPSPWPYLFLLFHKSPAVLPATATNSCSHKSVNSTLRFNRFS